MNQTIAPQCPNCESEMKLIPAGISKRTGKAYSPFYSCLNNRTCGSKPMSYIAPQQRTAPKSYNVPPTPQKPPTSQPGAVGGIPVSLSVLVGEILTIVQRIEKKLEKEIWADDVNEELNQEYNRKIQDENQ